MRKVDWSEVGYAILVIGISITMFLVVVWFTLPFIDYITKWWLG